MRRLVALAPLALLAACGGEGGAGTKTGTENPPAEPLPTEWRTEYWRDLQVDVPARWSFGGAPTKDGTGDRYACYAIAMVTATGEQGSGGDRTEPYVGRPVSLTDVCQTYPFIGPDAETPQAPSVWLGADIDPGTLDRGGGWTQETVEVNGSTLTVTTDDEVLHEQILESATGGETCLSEIEPAYDDTFVRTVGGDPRDAETLTVCAYRVLDEEEDIAPLVYAEVLGRDVVTSYLDSIEGAEPEDQCPTADIVEGEWVSLELGDAEGNVIRRDVVHLVCPAIDVDAKDARGFENVELTPARTAPWSRNGVRAVLSYFIGPQG